MGDNTGMKNKKYEIVLIGKIFYKFPISAKPSKQKRTKCR